MAPGRNRCYTSDTMGPVAAVGGPQHSLQGCSHSFARPPSGDAAEEPTGNPQLASLPGYRYKYFTKGHVGVGGGVGP